MKILAIPGSSRKQSRNRALLSHLQNRFPDLGIQTSLLHFKLPLYHTGYLEEFRHTLVDAYREEVREADAIIICTPEYLHNLPAGLKNALEWCNSTGEFSDKKVLPICYTPAAPRGEKAMQSLLWSLDALNARAMGKLLLHHSDIRFDDEGNILHNEIGELLDGAIELLH